MLWRFDLHWSARSADPAIGIEWRRMPFGSKRWWLRVFLYRRQFTAYYYPSGT